jgi:geranylgeranyl diphosphate synthase, type II
MNIEFIEKYLENQKQLIDSSLHHYLEESRQTSILFASLSYSIFSGGKRIRPILLASVYESVHGSINEPCLLAGCALEFIHTYSLIHDDLPCMDNSSTRRGKPTTHKLYGEDVALLAGDALLTEAFHLLTSNHGKQLFTPETTCSLVFELSKLSGIAGMVEGQAFEVMQEPQTIKEETLHYIIDHKTAALFDASLRMGAIVSDLSKEEQKNLGQAGRLFGHAFQLADDLHDFDSDKKEINFVNLVGKEATISLLNQNMEQCIKLVETVSFDSTLLQDIFNYFWKKSFIL